MRDAVVAAHPAVLEARFQVALPLPLLADAAAAAADASAVDSAGAPLAALGAILRAAPPGSVPRAATHLVVALT
jgi:hypothetical protein